VSLSTDSERTACRNAIRDRKYTHHYLSLAGDGWNLFTNISPFITRLKELVGDGIAPVVFLTSDGGTWRDQSASAINADLSEIIPQIDPWVSSYVLALEVDEYWSTSKANTIANHLQTLTTKKIGDHERPDGDNAGTGYDYCQASWCDYMALQTDPGTATFLQNKITAAKNALGKPVVAAEYFDSDGIQNTTEAEGVALGDAAVAAGAAGFGNGGTGTTPAADASHFGPDVATELVRFWCVNFVEPSKWHVDRWLTQPGQPTRDLKA